MSIQQWINEMPDLVINHLKKDQGKIMIHVEETEHHHPKRVIILTFVDDFDGSFHEIRIPSIKI
jgi:hypothetical protein